MVKMINFIRAQARFVGRWPPDLSSRDAFESDDWLMPQLENDALLYSLHDIIGEDLEDETSGLTIQVRQIEVATPQQLGYHLSSNPRPDNPIYRIAELKQRVRMAERELEMHRELLASDMQLHHQLNYGLIGETISEACNNHLKISASEIDMKPDGNTSTSNGDIDSNYFASYSGHGKCFLDLIR